METKFAEICKVVQTLVAQRYSFDKRIQNLELQNAELIQRLQSTEEQVKLFSLTRNQSNDFEIVKVRSSNGHPIESFKVRHKTDKTHHALRKVPFGIIGDQIRKVYSRSQYLTGLKHRNIIRYLSAWLEMDSVEGKTPSPVMYILTELCEKNTLQFAIRQGKFDQLYRHHLFGQLVSALEYLHAEKIIHGNLRTSSIFYVDHLQVRIGDYGLITKNGTTDYLQEQIDYIKSLVHDFTFNKTDSLENFDVARKLDLYSLGIVYLYMCYPTKKDGLVSTLLKIVYSPVSTPIQDVTPQDAKAIKTLLSCIKSQSSPSKLLSECKSILDNRERSSVNDLNSKKIKLTE